MRTANERREIEGRWWVDGMDKEPVYGVLQHDPSTGLTLSLKVPKPHSLIDIFAEPDQPEQAGDRIIHGRDKNDDPVTLYGCVFPEVSSSAAFKKLDFRPFYALLGRTFESWADTKFDHVHAEFTLLNNWMGTSRIQWAQPPTSGSVAVKVEEEKEMEVSLRDGVRLAIVPQLGWNKGTDEMQIEVGHGLRIRFPEPLPMAHILTKHVQSFRRLLTLFTGTPVFVERIYFEPQGNEMAQPANLLLSDQRYYTAKRTLAHHNMIASYPNIRNSFGDVMERWYGINKTLRDSLSLYFAKVFNPSLYSNQQFLFLAQALEVYHRSNTTFEQSVQPKADFRARKKRILDAIPDEKDWLNIKLAHANEKTLAERLQELLGRHTAMVPRFVADPQAFVQAVKNTRNHFTHYSTEEERADKVLEGTKLFRLTDAMQTLLEICFFSELGISGSPIEVLLRKLADRDYFTFGAADC